MFTNSEEYRADRVTVTVDWTQEAVLYNITIINIIPEVPVYYIGRTQVNLTLMYNTKYNMSLQAASVCENRVAGHLQLFYGKQ